MSLLFLSCWPRKCAVECPSSTEPSTSIMREVRFSVVLEEKIGRFGLVACKPVLKFYQTR